MSIPYNYGDKTWYSGDITSKLLDNSDYTELLENGTYFRVYRNSIDQLVITDGSAHYVPTDDFYIKEQNNFGGVNYFDLYMWNGSNEKIFYIDNAPNVNDSQLTNNGTDSVYYINGGVILADDVTRYMDIQNPADPNFDNVRYYIRAEITGTSADWTIYKQEINAPCIHPDMIVDSINKKISDITNIHMPNDAGYCDNLKLGYANEFIKIPQNVFGNGLPTADLLLTPKHPIMFNGAEIRVEELLNIFPTVKKIKLENPVMVYTLAFNTRKTIKMHGVDVWQWDINDFSKFCDRCGYVYDGYLTKKH